MATYGSNSVGFILVDGYNVLGQQTEINDGEEAILELNHALGDAWQKSAFVGVKKFALSQKGFFNDADGSVEAAFGRTNVGALRVICYSIEANTIGKHFEGFEGAGENSYKRLPALAALVKAEVSFVGGGKRETGRILHALGSETVSGDSTASSVDNSASTANGGGGYLQVTVLDTVPSASVSPSVSPSSSGSKSPSASVSPSASQSPSASTSPSTSVSPSQSPSASVSPSASKSPSASVSPSSSSSASVSPSASTSPSASKSPSASQSPSTSFSPSQSPSASVSPSASKSPSASSSLSVSPSSSVSPSPSPAPPSSLSVDILHSADNITFSVLGSFTVVTSAPSAQRISVAAGTLVNRYLAVRWTVAAGPFIGVTFMAGFARAA